MRIEVFFALSLQISTLQSGLDPADAQSQDLSTATGYVHLQQTDAITGTIRVFAAEIGEGTEIGE